MRERGRVWDTNRRGQFRDMPVWEANPVTRGGDGEVGRGATGLGSGDHSSSDSLYDLG